MGKLDQYSGQHFYEAKRSMNRITSFCLSDQMKRRDNPWELWVLATDEAG